MLRVLKSELLDVAATTEAEKTHSLLLLLHIITILLFSFFWLIGIINKKILKSDFKKKLYEKCLPVKIENNENTKKFI